MKKSLWEFFEVWFFGKINSPPKLKTISSKKNHVFYKWKRQKPNKSRPKPVFTKKLWINTFYPSKKTSPNTWRNLFLASEPPRNSHLLSKFSDRIWMEVTRAKNSRRFWFATMYTSNKNRKTDFWRSYFTNKTYMSFCHGYARFLIHRLHWNWFMWPVNSVNYMFRARLGTFHKLK